MSSYVTPSSQNSSKSTGKRPSTTKNFQAAFGTLSSSYGFGSSSRASSVPSQAVASSSSSRSLSRSSSSVGLLEKDTDSASLTGPSPHAYIVDLTRRSAPKAPAPRVSAPKNYEAAFGALSASYGFAGAAPSSESTHSNKPPKVPKAPKVQKQQQQQQPEAAPRTTTATPTKDFEAAYGALVSQSGWGSSVMPSTASQGVRFTTA